VIDARLKLTCCIGGERHGGGHRSPFGPKTRSTDYAGRRQAQALTVKILGYVFGYVETKKAPEGAYLLEDWRSGRPPLMPLMS